MHEEGGDLHGALYWTDRAAHWAQIANWTPMVAYTFVRRSMMAISFTNDGLHAVENAQVVLQMPEVSGRIKGLAAKQMGFGYALARQPDNSSRAVDMSMELLERGQEEAGPVIGQCSVVGDDLLALFQSTCDIYLGRSERPISVLEPRLRGIEKASPRTHTITCAKLARAYANAGQPGKACRLVLSTVEAVEKIGSLSARSELRRTLPVLGNWPNRSDVQEVRRRLSAR